MALKFAITDLAGEQVAVIRDYSNALVTVPYNDSRTAEVTLPAPSTLDDPIAANALALSRMLKVWYTAPPYNPLLVFWGPIITPTWTLRAGTKTLRIEAHDMSIRLKSHYLTAADTSIFTTDPGKIGVSYLGLRQLRDAGKNNALENLAGVPDLGIADGTNTHPGEFQYTVLTSALHSGDSTIHVEATIGFPDAAAAPDPNLNIDGNQIDYTGRTATTFTGATYSGSTIPAGTRVFYSLARALNVNKGDEIWQHWTEIANDPWGPDFRLRPDDATGGVYAYLDMFDKQETSEGGARDKRGSVIFQAGFGTDNVTDFEYAPQGGSLRNLAILQQAHTTSDGSESSTTAVVSNDASRLKYGNYVYWEAAGDAEQNTTESTLKGRGQAQLLAYSEPPQNFSFSPRSDESQRFFYGTHFMEGDVISCAAHFGALRIWLPGFISEVRLRQVSSTGQTKAEVDAIPVGAVNETDVS